MLILRYFIDRRLDICILSLVNNDNNDNNDLNSNSNSKAEIFSISSEIIGMVLTGAVVIFFDVPSLSRNSKLKIRYI